MKEKTRQNLLRSIGWSKWMRRENPMVRVIYVPHDVRNKTGFWMFCSISEAVAVGATNIRVHPEQDQLVADWPQNYFNDK